MEFVGIGGILVETLVFVFAFLVWDSITCLSGFFFASLTRYFFQKRSPTFANLSIWVIYP